MKTRLVLAFAAVLTIGLAANAQAQTPDKALVDKGALLYGEQKCALCHSIAGKGNPKGSLDGVGSKITADEIRLWLTDPKGQTAKTKATRVPAMKTYPNLQKADVDALVAYIASLKK